MKFKIERFPMIGMSHGGFRDNTGALVDAGQHVAGIVFTVTVKGEKYVSNMTRDEAAAVARLFQEAAQDA